MGKFRRLLIANRGEIAVRIARAAAAEGIHSVAAHSLDEAGSPGLAAADESVALPGEGPSAYLDVDAVVAAAVAAKCDAVHPGYGFLSERADLAEACATAGITFVGPTPRLLTLFGDKVAARAAARSAGLPVLAGSDGPVTEDEAVALLAEHGPLMLKAVAGGGGRGMRPVRDEAELRRAFASAAREASVAFGRAELYVEELVEGARHVEVQIAGDGGRVVHFHTRDCTLQRRRQKVIEVAPAWTVPEAVRQHLCDLAVRLGEAVSYTSLGTVEFLVGPGPDPTIAFIETNARLQVEHPVTEAVTGVDLVRLQLRLAGGASLGELGHYAEPALSGVAVEARILAETTGADGLPRPSTGVVTALTSSGEHRLDTFVAPGYELSNRYDSLLAKLVVHGDDAADAFAMAADALAGGVIGGVEVNEPELAELLRASEVVAGAIDVGFVERRAAPAPAASVGATVDRRDPLAVLDLGRQAMPARGDAADAGPAVVAPMPGTVVAYEVAVGDEVAAGTPVVVMEAMKMEHLVPAGTSGVVTALPIPVGEPVAEGTVLVQIDPREVTVAAADPLEDLDLDRIRPDLAEVQERHAFGLDEHRPEAVERRRKIGKRTARENIGDLVDPGSLLEYGPLVVAAQKKRRSIEELREKTPGDGLVGGIATVDGHAVAVASYDYTVLAGTQGLNNHRKKDRLFEVAEAQRLPVVFFTEGGGGRPGDTDGTGVAGLDCLAFWIFGRLSGLVPLVGVVSGRCFAGNAALAGCCDVIIATEDANLGMGGPAMIEGGGLGVYRPDEVGPVQDQVPSGVVDVLVADEVEATAVARRYLSYFTQPQVEEWSCSDQRRLRHHVPENRLRVYEVRDVIGDLFDTGSVLELRRGFGLGMVTALARIEGRAVGVIANDPTHLAGAIDADAADKAARFLQLCDAHDLPVVSLCDTPGIMVGPEAERTGLVRHAARMFVTAGGITVPLVTVVLRKGYGLGAQAMAGGSFHAPIFTIGWPTSEFGGMGLEGAVKLGYRNELAAIEDPEERQRTFDEMVDRMYEIGKGTNMAAAFEIDDVIDPADTRRWITTAFTAAPPPTPRTGKKRPNIDTW